VLVELGGLQKISKYVTRHWYARVTRKVQIP